MKTPRLPLGLFLAAAVIAADAPPSAVEGVKGVRQEGAAKVKNVDPRTARPVSPEKAEGVEQSATAVKPAGGPGTVAAPTPPPPPQGVGQEATAVKPAGGPGTASAPPPPPPPTGVDQGAPEASPVAGQGSPAPVAPPSPKGIGSVEGVKASGGGVIRAVEGVAGIDTEKLRNLEAALMAKPAPVPEDPKAKAKAAAQLLQKPTPAPKPAQRMADGRPDFQERIPDKGS
jgi:hypothetical protein